MSSAADAVLPVDVPHTTEAWWSCALLRVRWLLLRYVRRYAERLVQADGAWSDVAIGPQEFRRATGLARVPDRVNLVERLGVPSLEDCERVLDSTARALAAAGDENPTVWFGGEVLRQRLGLSQLELDLVLCAVAPRISNELSRLYPFVWADFTVRQPTAGFLADLVTDSPEAADALLAHGALSDDGTLLAHRLLVAGEHERWGTFTPRLHAPIAIEPRVVELLRSTEPPDTRFPGATLHRDGMSPDLLVLDEGLREQVAAQLEQPGTRVRLEGPRGSGRRTVVRSLHCEGRRGDLLVADLEHVVQAAGSEIALARIVIVVGQLLREARLLDAVLLIRLDDPDESLAEALKANAPALRRLMDAHPGAVLIACDERDGSEAAAALVGDVPRLRFDPPRPEGQLVLWRRALSGLVADDRAERLARQLSNSFQLTPGALTDAVTVAADHHRRAGRPPGTLAPTRILDTVQRRMTHKLGWLADTLVIDMSLDEVVFPPIVREQIDEILMFARHGYTVMHDWGMGMKSHGGPGLSVLLSGPPGTGKTLTAAVLGRELGRLVYRVDLSRVVDKYIGETEKNLGRVFDEAERAQAILLFDEADSLFAKRTSVKSSNDRYANLEVNFLLQRLEAYSGVCILTTNFATSIDEAFQRRIKFKVEFMAPEAPEREKLWRTLMPANAPHDPEEMDWEALADEFEFTGGHIRNAIMRGCIRAADLGEPVDTEIMYEAAVAESRELGLLVRS